MSRHIKRKKNKHEKTGDTFKKKIKIDEFLKFMIILNWIVLIGWVTCSYVLAWHSKNPNEMVTVSVAGTLLGSIIAYAIQNISKTKSANEHNIDMKTGQPFEIDNTDGKGD